MTKRRMHDGQMWENPKFARMGIMPRFLFCALIDIVDDQGRMIADPVFVRSRAFPFDDISAEDMESYLQTLAENGSILLYEADGSRYLQIVNWWKYQSPQWAAPSKLPAPEGWNDRIRYRLGNRVLTYGWTNRDGTALPDTCDAVGKPLPNALGKALPKDLPCPTVQEQDKGQGEEQDLATTTTTAPASEKNATDTLVGQVYRAAEAWIGRELTQTEGEVLLAALDDAQQLGLTWDDWQYAFHEAASANARELRYVFAILDRIADERSQEHPQDVWQQVLDVLRSQLSRSMFRHIANTRLASLDNSKAVVEVPNEHVKEMLESRLGTVIKRTLAAITDHDIAELTFRIKEQPP